jgi:hypothetical protein
MTEQSNATADALDLTPGELRQLALGSSALNAVARDIATSGDQDEVAAYRGSLERNNTSLGSTNVRDLSDVPLDNLRQIVRDSEAETDTSESVDTPTSRN